MRVLTIVFFGSFTLAGCTNASSILEGAANRCQAQLANRCSAHVGYIAGKLATSHGVIALEDPVVTQTVDAGVQGTCSRPVWSGKKAACAGLVDMTRSIHLAEKLFVATIQKAVFNMSRSSNLKTIYADAVETGHRALQDAFVNWTGPQPKRKLVLNAGVGFGFGLQIFCGCQEVFTTGMGFGGGLTRSLHGEADAVHGGQGGGGGFQIFRHDFWHKGQNVSLGGGGGGDLNASYGWDEDDDQSVPHRVTNMHDLWSNVVQQQIDNCAPGRLSITAGGGGGFGVVASSSGIFSNPEIRYGGGFGWHRNSKSFAHFNASCAGTISDTGDEAKFQKITELTNKCHDKCMSSPTAFYVCYCQCTKQVYISHGMAWAKKTQCPTSELASTQADEVVMV